MKVTALKPSEKDPQRFAAEFDSGDSLAVTVALIADFGLYAGRELDAAEYAALVAAVADVQSRARALRILGSRSMSRREISERLVRKGDSQERAGETADWLERIGAVNDGEYAALIVRHYAQRGYGEMRVRDELYRRGIPRELWEDALAQLTDTEETAYRALLQKLGGKTPDTALLKKAADALYRRGFSWDDIKAAAERYRSGHELSESDNSEVDDETDEE